jgi:hypothetical protein
MVSLVKNFGRSIHDAREIVNRVAEQSTHVVYDQFNRGHFFRHQRFTGDELDKLEKEVHLRAAVFYVDVSCFDVTEGVQSIIALVRSLDDDESGRLVVLYFGQNRKLHRV